MFPSYRVLSSQTTTIAECQWLFNCYYLFSGAESPTQATEDSEKAKTKEEKEFVRLVTDFVLQQRQKKAIAEKRF